MRSVVLLSGGLDSAVALAWASRRGEVLLAVTFDYGQRAARRETAAARKIAQAFGAPHKCVRLDWLGTITDTALVNRRRAVPNPNAGDLDSKSTEDAARAVWVPNRNAVFVCVAAAFAEALGADTVVAGFNAEEGATFPDNRPAFVRTMNRVLKISTLRGVRLVAPTQRLTKVGIVSLGRRLGVPLEHTWSCYLGGREPCGRCESCLRFARAVRQAGRPGRTQR